MQSGLAAQEADLRDALNTKISSMSGELEVVKAKLLDVSQVAGENKKDIAVGKKNVGRLFTIFNKHEKQLKTHKKLMVDFNKRQNEHEKRQDGIDNRQDDIDNRQKENGDVLNEVQNRLGEQKTESDNNTNELKDLKRQLYNAAAVTESIREDADNTEIQRVINATAASKLAYEYQRVHTEEAHEEYLRVLKKWENSQKKTAEFKAVWEKDVAIQEEVIAEIARLNE